MKKTMNVIDIKAERDLQPRVRTSAAVVAEYAALIESGITLPPVEVVYDGTDYWLTDGWQRVEAAINIGVSLIEANVTKGSRADAAWAAVTANSTHGLRRTNADKRRAVELALKHEKGKNLAAAKIAEHCGVSDKFVTSVSDSLVTAAVIPKKQTAAERAAEALADPANEGKSNREIADEIGVGRDTVNQAASDRNPNGSDFGQVALDPLKDQFDNELEGEVAIDFEVIPPIIKEHMKSLNSITAAINRMYTAEDRATRFLTHNRFKAAARELKSLLQSLVPHCLCPSCGGDGCTGCRNTGWVNKLVYSTTVPEDQKWKEVAK